MIYKHMAISDLLGKLQSINNSNLIDVFVPSQGRYVKFRQLSVRQQKDLIKTGLDGALAGATIANAFNAIIQENAAERVAFDVFDRAPIVLGLRVQSFGSTYADGEKTWDLATITQRTLQYNVPTSVTIQHEDVIQVQASVPTLERDTSINQSLIAQIKKTQDMGIGDAVGSLYVYELVKFVDSVTVAGDVVDFAKCTAADALRVVESLPAKLLVELVEFIQKFRTQEVEYLTIDGATLSMDARMFAQ